MTVFEQRPLYAAITARLQTSTNKAVGQGVAPDTTRPHMVLYPWPDIATEGSLSDPHQIAITRFQVTCVGDSMEEAQWMQHQVRLALIGWVPDLEAGTTPVELDEGSGVERDDQLTAGLWITTDRFRLWLTARNEEP